MQVDSVKSFLIATDNAIARRFFIQQYFRTHLAQLHKAEMRCPGDNVILSPVRFYPGGQITGLLRRRESDNIISLRGKDQNGSVYLAQALLSKTRR